MALQDEIAKKEERVRGLPHKDLIWLMEQSRTGKTQEKANCEGQPYADELREVIDYGYLELLDKIMECSARRSKSN